MAEPLLEIRDLRKEFGQSVAVAGIDLTVEAGGSLAVVGESGSGKTTVARMVVGLEVPTAGRIVVAGIDRSTPARTTRERRRRGREVQMVFQDPYLSLDPRQRVASALDEVLRLHTDMSRRARAARIAELARLVGLDERQIQSLPARLSGGQRQRVAVARALAAAPRLLILDEAVAALDVSIQAQVLSVLTHVREATGVAFMFISHDLAVVRQIADQVAVMNGGEIVERGETSHVLDSPKHSYTRLLRDSVPRPGWKPRRRDRHLARSSDD